MISRNSKKKADRFTRIANNNLKKAEGKQKLIAKMKNLRAKLIQNDIYFEKFYTLFITDFPIYKNPLFKKMISKTWYGENASYTLTEYAENLLKSIVQDENF